jgi:hypothetical protein
VAEKFVIPIHGQDHCPGGPDPIPCLSNVFPYVYRELLPANNDDTQAITTSNAGTIIVFDAASNPGLGAGASTVTEYGDGGESYFEPAAGDADAIDMTLPAQMRCYFMLQVKWADSFAGKTAIRFHSGAWGWFKSLYWEDPGGAVGNGSDSPLFYFENRMPAGTSQIHCQVEQWSGSTQHLASAFMEIGIINAFAGNPNVY